MEKAPQVPRVGEEDRGSGWFASLFFVGSLNGRPPESRWTHRRMDKWIGMEEGEACN